MSTPLRTLNDVAPQQGVSTPGQTSIGTTAGLVLAANAKRKGLSVQNTGTTVIKLTFAPTDPTQTVYDIALQACAASNDGSGGAYFDDAYVGEVRAISSGAGGTMVIKEFLTGHPDWNLAADPGRGTV